MYSLLYSKATHIAVTVIDDLHVYIMLCIEYHSYKVVQYQYKVRTKQLLKPSKTTTIEITEQHYGQLSVSAMNILKQNFKAYI